MREAQGAHFFDVDGHRYIDFCLGDTGAMTGHSPFATVKATKKQYGAVRADAAGRGRDRGRRGTAEAFQSSLLAVCAHGYGCESFFDSFGAQITGRPKILVFNWCYHGTVDETFVTIGEGGAAGPRRGNIGPPVNPAITTEDGGV